MKIKLSKIYIASAAILAFLTAASAVNAIGAFYFDSVNNEFILNSNLTVNDPDGISIALQSITSGRSRQDSLNAIYVDSAKDIIFQLDSDCSAGGNGCGASNNFRIDNHLNQRIFTLDANAKLTFGKSDNNKFMEIDGSGDGLIYRNILLSGSNYLQLGKAKFYSTATVFNIKNDVGSIILRGQAAGDQAKIIGTRPFNAASLTADGAVKTDAFNGTSGTSVYNSIITFQKNSATAGTISTGTKLYLVGLDDTLTFKANTINLNGTVFNKVPEQLTLDTKPMGGAFTANSAGNYYLGQSYFGNPYHPSGETDCNSTKNYFKALAFAKDGQYVHYCYYSAP